MLTIDRYNYRYHGGESYRDVVIRLEPIIMEMERGENIMVVTHQAVLRCIYAYFMNVPQDQSPWMEIPLHTMIKLTPRAYGTQEERCVPAPPFLDSASVADSRTASRPKSRQSPPSGPSTPRRRWVPPPLPTKARFRQRRLPSRQSTSQLSSPRATSPADSARPSRPTAALLWASSRRSDSPTLHSRTLPVSGAFTLVSMEGFTLAHRFPGFFLFVFSRLLDY